MSRALFALLLVGLARPVFAEDAQTLARAARDVLKTHCSGCHSGEGSKNGYKFDVLDVASMLKAYGDDEPAVLVPKDAAKSRIWVRAGEEKTMPPKGARPSPAELDTLRQWIEAGAPSPDVARNFTFISTIAQLKTIHDHLAAADPDGRPFLRFFTLTHLHNNPKVTVEDLRFTRAALAKSVNSLSRQPRLADLKYLDPAETIAVFDLRDVGWHKDRLWHAVLKEYPFGLDFTGSDDEALVRVQKDLNRLTRGELVYVRADWFAATATRAPLYYTLLQLPPTARELRDWLQVDFAANFRSDRLVRAGFPASGVSEQNRMVERHDSPVGSYYYESYDFKPRKARANLLRFPLGPAFPGNDFAKQSFDHDGGEMIFGLPNGLQGYYLADAKGNRISIGPIEVVNDDTKTSGTPAIVIGTSCMYCHKTGTILCTDAVREGNAVFGEAREKVRRLYPEPKVLDRLLKDDEARFVAALEKVLGPPLRTGADSRKPARDFAEPVGEVSRAYLKNVTLEKAAAELGIESAAVLVGMIRGNPALKELGILTLANGKTVKRDDWEAIDDGSSLFQDVALALRLGTPIRNR